MDIVRELRIYRLAFRIACERLAKYERTNADELVNQLIDQSTRLEAATQNEVA